MHPRQSRIPHHWLIVADLPDKGMWVALRRLRRGSGVLVLVELTAKDRRRLRHLATSRELTVAIESARAAARVHNVRELRHALLARTPLILLSPLYPTRSHPDWQPLPRMRAAALARLGSRRVLALGGMDARKFPRIRRLGFQAWAGISAFKT